MQEAIDDAQRRGTGQALDQWHAEGRLHLMESGLMPDDPREAAELRVRVIEKYGENPSYFDQVSELMAYRAEQYVPKAEVDRLAQEKFKAMQVSQAGEETRNTETPAELPPTGGTVADYAEACRLFNDGRISPERFKELRRQFGVS